MFPVEEEPTLTTVEKETERSIGRDLKFDMNSRRFVAIDGVIRENETLEDKVKQWLYLMLHNIPDKFAAYENTGYGVNTADLIGLRSVPVGFIYSELKREIENSAALNPAIDYLHSFQAERKGDVLSISFTVRLYTGEDTEVNMVV